MTDDVFLTLSLLLMGALLARFVASLIGIPEILVLVAIGALFGPSPSTWSTCRSSRWARS